MSFYWIFYSILFLYHGLYWCFLNKQLTGKFIILRSSSLSSYFLSVYHMNFSLSCSSCLIYPLPPGLSLGCDNKLPEIGWLQLQSFMSHLSGSWEIQDQGAGRSGVGESLLSDFLMAIFSLCSDMGERTERFLYLLEWR